MPNILKVLAARFPKRWQQTLKRFHFGRQIRRGRLRSSEPEYDLLAELVFAGDWVVDVGANVGHYSIRLSGLVGGQGRVVAFEPVPETLELLASNIAMLPAQNVTLINAAASDRVGLASMTIPEADTGLDNNYLAHLSAAGSGLQVLCLTIDALDLPHAVRLVKIDAEGHELAVLKGMRGILRRDSPVLIVEDNSNDVPEFLKEFGYTAEKLPGSSNLLFRTVGAGCAAAEGHGAKGVIALEGVAEPNPVPDRGGS